MNIKELKKLIADMPDDVEIFVTAEDHSHEKAVVRDYFVVDGEGYYSEYYPSAKYGPNSVVKRALVVWL